MDAANAATALKAYKDTWNLDAVLADAVNDALRAGATNPYQHIGAALSARAVAPATTADGGDAAGITGAANAANLAAAGLGVLKHKAPAFHHFDPVDVERRALVMKEMPVNRPALDSALPILPLSASPSISPEREPVDLAQRVAAD